VKILAVPDCSLGVITDQPPEELPAGAWTDARNVRFKGGVARSMRGISQVFNAPAVTPYAMLPYAQAGSTYWVHCGLAAVYVDDGTTRTDITGTAPTGGIDNRWTGGVLGGVLVLNNGVDVPMFWGGNTALNLATLTGWDVNWRAGFLRPWRTFLLAGDITKAGTRYPHMLKLSDSASPGAIPGSWDATNPALDAVERDAAQTEDYLIDMMPMGDMAIVYKTRSMYFIRETFDARVIELQRLPGDYGMLARGCGAVTPVGHVVLAAGDVIVHSGQGAQSIADDVVRKRIFAGIDSANTARCFVTANPAQSEVWICFPESGQTTCTLAAVWNWDSKRWTFRTLPNLTHGAFGAIVATPSSDLVDSGTGAVDADGSLVDEIDAPPNESRLVVCNATAIGVVDSGPTDFGAALTWYLERYGLQSGADDNGQVMMLTDVIPRLNASAGAAVTITVGAAMTPSGSYQIEAPVTLTVGTDYEANVFATGRYFYLRLDGSTSDTALRSLQLDGSPQGMY
jgi:hypothetical protein